MKLQSGIIGLPNSGKTTVFNALSGARAQTATYSSVASEPNVAVVHVPDRRLDALAALYHPKKVTPADIQYVDMGLTRGFSRGEGISRTFIDLMTRCDALLHVVRAFPDEAVPHPEGSVDPDRDIANVNLELMFSDLALSERRLERIEESRNKVKPPEREALLAEAALLGRIKGELEREIPLRAQTFSPEEEKLLRQYQFLSSRPLLIVLNVGEDQVADVPQIQGELRARYGGVNQDATAICGKIEEEIAQLDPADAEEFRQDLGIAEPALDRVIHLTYDLLGTMSFLTAGPPEVRAWTIRKNTPAVEAAGVIHSDIERGFIRAEVVSFDDLIRCGGIPEARKHGLLRLEGKQYIVRDGDVIHFLFNI